MGDICKIWKKMADSLQLIFSQTLGTGGIKPCVAAFGGDQFKLPEQERQLQTFFSVFYFSINAGSLISTFITPIFR
jgi:solute carrier family 15 oligopeptide transporter 1